LTLTRGTTLDASGLQQASGADRIGELLIREGLITQTQLDNALQAQRELQDDGWTPIGHILVSHRLITRTHLIAMLKRHRKRLSLGGILLKMGAISHEQLGTALEDRKRTGRRLGDILIDLRYASEETIRRALGVQLHIKFLDLDGMVLDSNLSKLVNDKYALKHLIVPVAKTDNLLVVAMDDPTNTSLIHDVQSSTGLNVEVVTSTTQSIRRAYARLYGAAAPLATEGREELILTDPSARALYERLSAGEVSEPRLPRPGADATLTSGAELIVRDLLLAATAAGASDIHLEAVDGRMVVRFRIDGMLQSPNDWVLESAVSRNRGEVVSRIKIISQLDIAERRRPQDGSFRAKLEKDGRELKLDFRVSVIPGHFGENVVLRMLDSRNVPASIDQLGLSTPITEQLRRLITTSAGIILVTGPTGSGKSTTLFAALQTLYRPAIKILTAENPIEYVCDKFSQYEVNERLGNTFASYLRAFLRHDPEVIMIGEIRDRETAELAFRAAQTGHLVLSTMHTNDAISTITRLWDLGIDGSTITSSLVGVLSQRLVRQVCVDCRAEYIPPASLLRALVVRPPAGLKWYRGRGCLTCHSTGYKGRICVAELWTPSDADVVLVNKQAPFEEIRRSAEASTISISDDVRDKLLQGRTNLEELVRVVPLSSLHRLALTPIEEPTLLPIRA
jgi:type II secretory ATPase GspE/PulE/Tfp pilus assembly ATPase PilB-like protein